ncbi:sigma-70 family RNA polymerase sigma factor [Paenibacillus planticolens]|uniref:Sigma-70 family RNA polymerase sigma factor n=1 Tax=Paenibacillus planticolens TaxID=2654976 RepID=A0ABX1ZIY3_9BACL|nr:sigma-70 family RNA polymerase sigma factor [Paenibacillus planticolens]NOU98806.1 sigma-70 family RNA polymerase sigma factor [Paenibacillus planticolens]
MNEDDQHLANALRRRLPSALEGLMDRYGNGVYGLVNRILAGAGQTEDVEECVSDVFLAAWRRIDEYDEEKGSFRTWLLILAKYSALDARRKLLRRPGAGPFEDRVADGASVEDKVITKEASAEMIALVNDLPEPDRTIFYRRYFYYESVEQISRGLSLTGKAVENRLYRLRKMFKAKLGEGRLE